MKKSLTQGAFHSFENSMQDFSEQKDFLQILDGFLMDFLVFVACRTYLFCLLLL